MMLLFPLPGVDTVHLALVAVEERHRQHVVRYGSGQELSQHLWHKTHQSHHVFLSIGKVPSGDCTSSNSKHYVTNRIGVKNKYKCAKKGVCTCRLCFPGLPLN